MPTLYYCYDLTDEGRYCGSTHPEEKSCFLCAECLAEAEGQAQVLETLTRDDSHQEAFCWECGARLTDAVSPMSAFYAQWLASELASRDLESQYEDAQNGGLDID